MTPLIAELAGFVAGPLPDWLAAKHADQVREHVLDTMAALAAGAASQVGRTLARTDPDPHRPFLSVPRTHWTDRAALAAAIIRSTDIDDIHMASCVTPSSAVLPVALALAGAMGEEGRRRLPGALVAGTELMIRLGQACRGPEILYAGIWPTSLTASLGAAATIARLLGLDAPTTAHALAGALSVAAGRMGPAPGLLPMRWFLFGQQVRAGCLAALSAARGEHGDLSLLDGRWMEAVLGARYDRAHLTDGLGESCALAETSIKIYCGAKMIAAGIQAFRELLAGGIAAEAISGIEIAVPTLLVGILDRGISASDSLSWFTSAPLQMALAAYKPADLLTVDRPRIVVTGPMQALMGKVRVRADAALDEIYPAHWPARVTVTGPNGPVEAAMTVAQGDPGAPVGEDGLAAKWRRLFSESPLAGEAEDWFSRPMESELIEILSKGQDRILGTSA